MDRAEAEAVYDAGRDASVEFLLELTSGYDAQIARLEERIRRLEEQARRDSRTSSKPPSSDPPKTRQQRRAEARAKAKELLRGERKAGGQTGHPGSGRELEPEDHVDEIVDHYPDVCRGCGQKFPEDERKPAGRFGRHQVAELPPISVVLVEPVGLPGVRGQDDGAAAGRDRWLGIWGELAGGVGELDRAQPDLAAGDRGAGTGSVQGELVDRHGRSDLSARRGCARRPARAAA